MDFERISASFRLFSRGETGQKSAPRRASELSAAQELLLETSERLRLREAAAPELAAAELLATEAERLEERGKRWKPRNATYMIIKYN